MQASPGHAGSCSLHCHLHFALVQNLSSARGLLPQEKCSAPKPASDPCPALHENSSHGKGSSLSLDTVIQATGH